MHSEHGQLSPVGHEPVSHLVQWFPDGEHVSHTVSPFPRVPQKYDVAEAATDALSNAAIRKSFRATFLAIKRMIRFLVGIFILSPFANFDWD